MRLPFAGFAGACLLQHSVNLFEGKTLHFRDEEVGERDGKAAERAPDKEYFGSEIGVALGCAY